MNNQHLVIGDTSEVPVSMSRNSSTCGISLHVQEEVPLVILYKNALEKNIELEKQLEYLTGVMLIMKEDLQVKDEQFDFLYTSLRARNEQEVQSRKYDEQALRARVEHLETVILERNMEKDQLRKQLNNANHKLKLFVHSGASTCWYNSVPDDVQYRILKYMDANTLACMSGVCKRINLLATVDFLWIPRFRTNLGKSKMSRVEKLGRSWKQIYCDYMDIEDNWRRQKSQLYDCKGHNGTVTCLALHGDRLVSGSDDGSMVLWDLDSIRKSTTERQIGDIITERLLPPPGLPLAQLVGCNRLSSTRFRPNGRHSAGAGAELGSPVRQPICSKLRSFHGHGGPVWCLDYDPISDRLVSGSYDKTVKVWDGATGSCMRTLRGHSDWVSSLSLIANRSAVVSASWDCSIHIWDLEGGNLMRTLFSGIGNALYCIGVTSDDETVGVGCRHSQIQLWNLERGILSDELLGHGKEVYCLQMADRMLFSGSGDSTVKVWDAVSKKCVLTLRDHSATVMTLQYDHDYRVVSGSYDKTVKVWDIRHGSSPLTTIAAHNAAVFCLKFDDDRLVTGSADHTLKVFNFASTAPTSNSLRPAF